MAKTLHEISKMITKRDTSPVGRKVRDTYGGRLTKEEGESYDKMSAEISKEYAQYLHEKKVGGARTESFKEWKDLD